MAFEIEWVRKLFPLLSELEESENVIIIGNCMDQRFRNLHEFFCCFSLPFCQNTRDSPSNSIYFISLNILIPLQVTLDIKLSIVHH